MRPSASRFRSAAVAALLAALAAPRVAAAQACCAGASALTPARLALHEDAIAGVQVRATDIFGSFDGARRFLGASKGAAEVDLEQDLVGVVRVASHAQISVVIPFVETWRKVPGLYETGGGIGDVQLGFRYDFPFPKGAESLPSVALLAALAIPSGRAPEDASKPLATDATGTGSSRASLGLALERTFGDVLVNLTGTLALRSERTVGEIREQPGLELAAFAAGGYTFKNGAVLALTAAYSVELDSSIGGAVVPGSGRAGTRLGLAGGYVFNDAWRIQGSAFGDLPIHSFGRNQPAGAGLATALIRSF